MTKINIRNIFRIASSFALLLFQGYLVFVRPLPPIKQLPIHLALALMIAIANHPIYSRPKDVTKISWKDFLCIIDIVIILSLCLMIWYYVTQYDFLIRRIQYLDPQRSLDYLMLGIVLFSVLESIRRIMGYNLLIFIVFFIVYAVFGKYFPSVISHRGLNLKRFTDLITMGTEGIFGTPLNASVSFLYYFIIFGTFFAAGGGGQMLVDLGMKLGRKDASGPAKASIFSSALFGMISGSAVANVTTTGVMTIPLMKRTGYKPEQAGAIEAVASTGGQITPPIMAATAFIMAEMIGIPYSRIALSAIIPAFSYYLSLYLLVDFISRKGEFGKEAIMPKIPPILPRLYLQLPIILLVVIIFRGRSLQTCAVYAIFTFFIVNFLRRVISKGTQGMSLKEIFNCLLDGSKQVSHVAIPTAACGIIIGVVIMSGLASKFSVLISNIGGGNLLLALFFTMLGCMVLGMALPTVAAYLTAYILFIPVLTRIGVPTLPANMFIFYFGVISQITPPVCLAAFAAAGIAEAKPWLTGWTAFKYASVAFLVPYVFVEKPELLLMGSPMQTIFSSLILIFGIFILASGIAGYLFKPINSKILRIFLFITAFCIIFPENISTYIGLILGCSSIIIALIIQKRAVATAKA